MNRPQVKQRHDPADICVDWHCYIHNVDEIAGGRAYRRCLECWHLYRSKRELVREWAKWHWTSGRDLGLPPIQLIKEILTKKADDIYVCQHCAHDF